MILGQLYKKDIDQVFQGCVPNHKTCQIITEAHQRLAGAYQAVVMADVSTLLWLWTTAWNGRRLMHRVITLQRRCPNFYTKRWVVVLDVLWNWWVTKESTSWMKWYRIWHICTWLYRRNQRHTTLRALGRGKIHQQNFRSLKKIVEAYKRVWDRKLDNALWAFWTSYKVTTGMTLFQVGIRTRSNSSNGVHDALSMVGSRV